MDCETAREAISALLDGEPPGLDPSLIDEHLAACPECRRWRERAHEITRRTRLAAAGPVPAPSEVLLRALAPAAPGVDGLPPARAGLAATGLVQLVATAPALVLGSDHDAPVHVAHEMGSFDVALAVGFIVAAWRPAHARGMRPLVGVTALLLAVTAVVDMIAGRTTLAGETPHLFAIVGWLLLGRLAALAPPDDQQAAPRPRIDAPRGAAPGHAEASSYAQAPRRAGEADVRRAAHG